MSEWGVLAVAAGVGFLALSRTKNLGQMEQAAKQMKNANTGNFRLNINKIIQSHEYAGGFKDSFTTKIDKEFLRN